MSKLNAVKGRWKLGLLLALGTATMWGTLPVALQQVAPTIGPATSSGAQAHTATYLPNPVLVRI